MSVMDLQLETKRWVESIQTTFEGVNEDVKNTVFVAGYFFGWTVRELIEFADQLASNTKKRPPLALLPKNETVPEDSNN